MCWHKGGSTSVWVIWCTQLFNPLVHFGLFFVKPSKSQQDYIQIGTVLKAGLREMLSCLSKPCLTWVWLFELCGQRLFRNHVPYNTPKAYFIILAQHAANIHKSFWALLWDNNVQDKKSHHFFSYLLKTLQS